MGKLKAKVIILSVIALGSGWAPLSQAAEMKGRSLLPAWLQRQERPQIEIQDMVPPTVQSLTPDKGVTVPSFRTITVIFSEEMNSGTMNSFPIKVTKCLDGLCAEEVTIPGATTVNYGNQAIYSFFASQEINEPGFYRIRISKDFQDKAGLPLEDDFTSFFYVDNAEIVQKKGLSEIEPNSRKSAGAIMGRKSPKTAISQPPCETWWEERMNQCRKLYSTLNNLDNLMAKFPADTAPGFTCYQDLVFENTKHYFGDQILSWAQDCNSLLFSTGKDSDAPEDAKTCAKVPARAEVFVSQYGPTVCLQNSEEEKNFRNEAIENTCQTDCR